MKQAFTHSIIIKAPIHDLYELITDPLRISKFVPRVIECRVIAGPGKGKGTITRWVWDDGRGHRTSWEEEIIEAIPDRKMVFKYHNYRNIIGIQELEITSEGTRITFTETHDYPGIDPKQAQQDVEHVLLTLRQAMESR